MKIAFFLENIQFGGLDTFTINLLNNWEKSDELILIVNSSHPGLNLLKSRLDKKVKVMEHNVPLTWDLSTYLSLPNIFIKVLKLIYFIIDIPIQVYMLKKLFKRNKFDKLMVVNGGYPGGDSCLSATIAWGKLYPNNKGWHNFHNLVYSKKDYKGLNKLKYYRSILIDKYVSKYAKGFVSVSKSSIDSLSVRDSFKNTKNKFIYNGIDVDLDLKNTISIKEKYALPKDAIVISVLGVYEPRKGQDFLIKAFSKIDKINKNIYLLMFGKGDDKYIDYLKSLIGGNKNIYLEDYQENIKQIYKGIDILTIPSQSHESFGYTAVEAMAYKIPIVATNIGGLPEVVKDNECGYIVKHNDINAMAERLFELCENESKRSEFGQNGFDRYHKLFSAKVMANKYKKLIGESV